MTPQLAPAERSSENSLSPSAGSLAEKGREGTALRTPFVRSDPLSASLSPRPCPRQPARRRLAAGPASALPSRLPRGAPGADPDPAEGKGGLPSPGPPAAPRVPPSYPPPGPAGGHGSHLPAARLPGGGNT